MNLYVYVHNDPMKYRDPTGAAALYVGFDFWFTGPEDKVVVKNPKTGQETGYSGGMVGAGFAITFPFKGDGTKWDFIGAGARGKSNGADFGFGVGFDGGFFKGGQESFQGNGSQKNIDVAVIGVDRIYDDSGDLIGATFSPGGGIGYGDFDTKNGSYGLRNLFDDVKGFGRGISNTFERWFGNNSSDQSMEQGGSSGLGWENQGNCMGVSSGSSNCTYIYR